MDGVNIVDLLRLVLLEPEILVEDVLNGKKLKGNHTVNVKISDQFAIFVEIVDHTRLRQRHPPLLASWLQAVQNNCYWF